MRRTIAAAALVAGLTILAGCGDKGDSGTLNEQENRQLDNAAEMLDASPDSATANEEAPLGNGDVDVVETEEAVPSNEGSANSAENAE